MQDQNEQNFVHFNKIKTLKFTATCCRNVTNVCIIEKKKMKTGSIKK